MILFVNQLLLQKQICQKLPVEIQDVLSEFRDIIVDDLPNELPPITNISHHMDFIPGVSLRNKDSYRMTPQENEEIRK